MHSVLRLKRNRITVRGKLRRCISQFSMYLCIYIYISLVIIIITIVFLLFLLMLLLFVVIMNYHFYIMH
jgi:Flp pilus assembly protein TadB